MPAHLNILHKIPCPALTNRDFSVDRSTEVLGFSNTGRVDKELLTDSIAAILECNAEL